MFLQEVLLLNLPNGVRERKQTLSLPLCSEFMKDFICKRCGQAHPLVYITFGNGTEHLCYECPRTKQRFFLHYVAGLNIQRIVPRRVEKQNRSASQLKLL